MLDHIQPFRVKKAVEEISLFYSPEKSPVKTVIFLLTNF
jgi:hypothetical protein